MGGSANPKNTAKPAPQIERSPVMRPAPPPQAGPVRRPPPPVTPAPAMRAPSGPNVFQQASGALTDAMGGARAAMGYQPERINTNWGYNANQVQTQWGYSPERIAAQQAVGGINTYMNPYEQQVVDLSLADLNRANRMAMQDVGAQATAAGAFGGSRHGLVEAETNRAFADQAARTAAALRQAGFNTALSASQQDVANQMQAGLANQSAFNNAQQFGQQLGMQGQLANQQALNAERQFAQNLGFQSQSANQQAGLQGAGLRLNAANALGGLGQSGFNQGMAIQQQQMQQGALQQAAQQQLIDAAKGQYAGFTGAPANSLQAMLAAVGAGNMGQQTQTTSRQPGLFDYLTLGATAIGGLCWVAREVYGAEDGRWLQFREWLLTAAPKWLLRLYATHGEAAAKVVRKAPVLKRILRPLMDRARRAAGYEG